MADELLHYGIKRRSGRYPWGSGEDPYQRESWAFLNDIDNMRAKGMSDKDIYTKMGMTSTQFRSRITIANKHMQEAKLQEIESRHQKGESNIDIARAMGISEGSVRQYLKKAPPSAKQQSLDNTVDALKRGLEKTGYLDVGVGIERQIGISREQLKAARQRLKDEGYVEHDIYIKQISDPNKWTTIKVLTKEKDVDIVKKNQDKIRTLEEWTEDYGMTYKTLQPPKLIKLDRVKVRYAEEGGSDKDGLIELRRGVEDLDLGTAKYAQVRIGTEGRHYLKGMAMYTDAKFPNGVDIIFNTNKNKGTPKEKVLKKMEDSDDFPFGSYIRKQRGAINIVNEEGHWNEWSGKISSQFLGKQPVALIKERLNDTYSSIQKEYKEILSLTNPAVKRHVLSAFSDGLVAKARDLKAKGFAGTKSHVLLPFPDMKPNEIYAPNYKNGSRVVLVRHPHGGKFEIPQLTVNNNAKSPKKILKDALDAVGIHPANAAKLSGADFDGDTVLVIPNNSGRIRTSRSLEGLKNFNPQSYKVDPKRKITMPKDFTKQLEMGKISNLITDMSIQGATDDELARAVRHSMVVIDAKKHNLDYKASERDNAIGALKKKYQTVVDSDTGRKKVGAASTLLSRAKNEKIAPNGKKAYQMDLVKDARKLSTGTEQENAYADFANKLKDMRIDSQARLEAIPKVKYNPVVAKQYATQVKSLDTKLHKALLNAPRERQAQILATKLYYKNIRPDMDKDRKKKLRSQMLAEARAKTIPGGKKEMVDITQDEWEAIQKGAVSQSKLDKILLNANIDKVRQLATPKVPTKLATATVTRAQALIANGYTFAEVAEKLGVSVSTVRDYTSKNVKKG